MSDWRDGSRGGGSRSPSGGQGLGRQPRPPAAAGRGDYRNQGRGGGWGQPWQQQQRPQQSYHRDGRDWHGQCGSAGHPSRSSWTRHEPRGGAAPRQQRSSPLKTEEDGELPNGPSANAPKKEEGGDPEARHTELLDLVKGKSASERRALFLSLPFDDKLVVQGYPRIGYRYSNPLPEELPHEARIETAPAFEAQKQEAARRALEAVKARFSQVDDDYDEDDDSSEESCDMSPYCRCRRCKQQKPNNQFDSFVLALPHCLLFDIAFRIRWPRKSDKDLSWCPCGGYMKPWQEFFGLAGTEDMDAAAKICGDQGKKKKEPYGLVAHLRKQGMDTSDPCPLHFCVVAYLEELYKNHNGTGLAHKAFYKNVNTRKYEEAVSAEYKQTQRMFNEMQSAILGAEERERLMRKENEEFKKKMASLDKVNHDYKIKVEQTEEMLRKLGLQKEEKEPALSDRDYESFRLIYRSFFGDLKAKVSKPRTVKFAVANNFDLQELFDELDAINNKDNSFLLRDLSYRGDAHYHAPKLLFDWEIQIGDAIDEGGVTKHFFDQVWQQLLALKVCQYGLEVNLFREAAVGIIPSSNEDLTFAGKGSIESDVKDAIVDKAKRYYRAVGRIMFHSLARNFVVSSTALPAFYRNVLFRECDLQDTRYKHRKIIKDVQAMGENVAEQLESTMGKSLSVFGLDDDEVVNKSNFIKKVIPHFCVHNKSIALDALKEGLTLDGFADVTAIFRIMPEKAVSRLLFAPSKIKAGHIIDALKPVYSTATDEILDSQKYFFENVLKATLVEKAREDDGFLSSFLSFATGQSFMPHPKAAPDFEIRIEFNMDVIAEKARPSSKTCVNALILPYHAYNSDREVFTELLTECIAEMRANNFSDD